MDEVWYSIRIIGYRIIIAKLIADKNLEKLIYLHKIQVIHIYLNAIQVLLVNIIPLPP